MKNRLCNFSSHNGGQWVKGYFHRWIDTKDTDTTYGTKTKALVENIETGRMEVVNIDSVVFYEEDDSK